MKIIFCDTNNQNLEALKNAFGDLPYFDFKCNQINSVVADCIVSPANSYGLMDGGVDRVINYCLNYISEKVKNIIQSCYNGEQPVGTCLIIPTYSNSSPISCPYKYLAHTPIMRVPKDISNTDNAYLAFRALLNELFNHNRKYNDINTAIFFYRKNWRYFFILTCFTC
jgi:O-acetyl-ADP-ribose deacetylase (regulator of RNase III)